MLGYDNKAKKYVLWVLDTKNDRQYGPIELKSADNSSCAWLEPKGNNIDLYAGRNLFTVVAGDFDGDGKETIIIIITYTADDDNNFGLTECKFDGNNITQWSYGEKGALNEGYVRSVSSFKNKTKGKNKLSVDLAVGDFNGDGIDDLAVLSYVNYGIDSDNRNALGEDKYLMPCLNIVYGKKSGGHLLDNDKSGAVYVTSGVKDGSYVIPICSGLSAGDINNDGRDEIVIAGYKGGVKEY